MTQSAPLAPPVPVQQPEKSKASGLLLAIILVGQFLAILNVNIVNVATPTIEATRRTRSASQARKGICSRARAPRHYGRIGRRCMTWRSASIVT